MSTLEAIWRLSAGSGISPPAIISMFSSRVSASRGLFACRVVIDPGWPVFMAWSISRASPPRTSPTMIRSGRILSVFTSRSRIVTCPVPSALTLIVDGEVSPGLSFDSGPSRTRVAGMIDALSRAGLANVLARPNVTAVSGEAASFFSGGEYPLPTGFDDGVIVFEYKKYGILLDFVPTVIDTGRIVLKVRPEVSEPSLNQAVRVVGVDIPVINVRRAETTVEVGDGESIVIAGLFRNASDTREAGVPGLKDIPGLGILFGSRSVQSEELELIVIVTARLVTANARETEAEAPPPPRLGGYYY